MLSSTCYRNRKKLIISAVIVPWKTALLNERRHEMDWLDKLAMGVGISILAIGLIAIVSVAAAIPTYFLWNWLMPEIFGVKVITFWQAWGVNFLVGILFKNSSFRESSNCD